MKLCIVYLYLNKGNVLKIKKSTLAKFFGVSRQSINNWEKEEDKYAVAFVTKYITDDDANEFIEKGIISKFEVNQQAIDLQKKIYRDDLDFTEKKRNIKEEDPQKKCL